VAECWVSPTLPQSTAQPYFQTSTRSQEKANPVKGVFKWLFQDFQPVALDKKEPAALAYDVMKDSGRFQISFLDLR
jgi:hypothetical protein